MQNRWDMEKKILEKAMKDPEFKKRLLSHPKETVRKCFKDLPLDEIDIVIHKEKKGEWVIAIPDWTVQLEQINRSDLKKLTVGAISGANECLGCSTGSCNYC